MRQPLLSQKSGPLSGRIAAPGDKSISHRALILGALSMGTSRITGLLQADDVMATAAALVQLGAKVANERHEWFVTGRGVGGLMAPEAALDFGNSGTGARLMMGAVAGHEMTATFTGDESLKPTAHGARVAALGADGAECGRGPRDLAADPDRDRRFDPD